MSSEYCSNINARSTLEYYEKLNSRFALEHRYREKSTTQDEAFSHWEDSDRKILVDACDKAEKWLNTVSESLSKTPKHVTPTTTVKMIQAAVSELHTSCLPVITKPKPKPKEPEKKEETKKEDEGEKKEDDKMDTEEASNGEESTPMDTEEESSSSNKNEESSSEPMDTTK